MDVRRSILFLREEKFPATLTHPRFQFHVDFTFMFSLPFYHGTEGLDFHSTSVLPEALYQSSSFLALLGNSFVFYDKIWIWTARYVETPGKRPRSVLLRTAVWAGRHQLQVI